MSEDIRCPVCTGPIDVLRQFEVAPTRDEFVQAWVELDRPLSMDLSEDLFKAQSGYIWPKLGKLDPLDPFSLISAVSIRPHPGGGFWMRPAAITYVQLPCTECGGAASYHLPEALIPKGMTAQCPGCAKLRELTEPDPIEEETNQEATPDES